MGEPLDPRHSRHRTIDRQTFLRGSVGAALTVASLGTLAAACGGSTPSATETSPAASDGSGSTATPTSAADPGPPKTPTGVLRVANPTEPAALDPVMSGIASDLPITRNVYDSLVAWNADYTELVPSLATSWESSDDAREWAFNLRPGVTFHDGEPFDAAAVRASLEYYVERKGVWSFMVPTDMEIDDSDPAVVRITIAAPFPDMLRNQLFVRMVSPRLVAGGQKAVERTPVGAGPFRFVRWDKGRSVVLEAFEDYWGAGPFLERLEFPTIQDPTARLNALLTRQVDLVERVPPPQLQQLADDPDLTIDTSDSWANSYLIFTTNQKPLDDVRVRQAIAYGIDREAIVQNIFLGQGSVVDSVLPPGVYGYREPSTTYAYDPDRARALLQEAGYGGGVTIPFLGAAGVHVLGEQVREAIVGQLEEIGIDLRLDVVEDVAFGTDLFGDKPRYPLHYGEFSEVTGGPFVFSVGIVGAWTRYDTMLTDLTAELNTTPDGAERETIIGELQDLVASEMLALTVIHQRVSDVFRSDLKGYRTPRDIYIAELGTAYYAT